MNKQRGAISWEQLLPLLVASDLDLKTRVDFVTNVLRCLHAMDSLDSLLVQHLPNSRCPARPTNMLPGFFEKKVKLDLWCSILCTRSPIFLPRNPKSTTLIYRQKHMSLSNFYIGTTSLMGFFFSIRPCTVIRARCSTVFSESTKTRKLSNYQNT